VRRLKLEADKVIVALLLLSLVPASHACFMELLYVDCPSVSSIPLVLYTLVSVKEFQPAFF